LLKKIAQLGMHPKFMIGIFDSGIGGLTVLKALSGALPEIPMTYLADFGYAPYGNRSAQEILDRSGHILNWMKQGGVSLVVVACHTSSAVLSPLLLASDLPVVTMLEPTLHSILMHPQRAKWNKGIGLIATALTVEKGTLVAALHQRSWSLPIHAIACPELAPLIEAGQWDRALDYMQAHPLAFFAKNPVDAIVYGCTHYPFIEPFLESNQVRCAPRLDPAETVAGVVTDMLGVHKKDLSPDKTPMPHQDSITFYHTGKIQEGHDHLAYHWPNASSQHITLPGG
jgi:glutamate racemase